MSLTSISTTTPNNLFKELQTAVGENNSKKIQEILDKGGKNLITSFSEEDHSSLAYAIRLQNVDVIKTFFEAGLEITAPYQEGGYLCEHEMASFTKPRTPLYMSLQLFFAGEDCLTRSLVPYFLIYHGADLTSEESRLYRRTYAGQSVFYHYLLIQKECEKMHDNDKKPIIQLLEKKSHFPEKINNIVASYLRGFLRDTEMISTLKDIQKTTLEKMQKNLYKFFVTSS